MCPLGWTVFLGLVAFQVVMVATVGPRTPNHCPLRLGYVSGSKANTLLCVALITAALLEGARDGFDGDGRAERHGPNHIPYYGICRFSAAASAQCLLRLAKAAGRIDGRDTGRKRR